MQNSKIYTKAISCRVQKNPLYLKVIDLFFYFHSFKRGFVKCDALIHSVSLLGFHHIPLWHAFKTTVIIANPYPLQYA
jgi:hypothetical protein